MEVYHASTVAVDSKALLEYMEKVAFFFDDDLTQKI